MAQYKVKGNTVSFLIKPDSSGINRMIFTTDRYAAGQIVSGVVVPVNYATASGNNIMVNALKLPNNNYLGMGVLDLVTNLNTPTNSGNVTPGNLPNTSATQTSSMASFDKIKLVVLENFTARQFFFAPRPESSFKIKLFNKGDVIEGKIGTDFAKNRVLVSSDGFNIPTNMVKELQYSQSTVNCITAPCPPLNNTNPDITTKTNQQEEPEQRDVLEGGFWTRLFPGYGGGGKSVIIRLIFVIAIILLLVWAYKKYIKK